MNNGSQAKMMRSGPLLSSPRYAGSGSARSLYPLAANADRLGKRMMPAFFVGRESASSPKRTRHRSCEAVPPDYQCLRGTALPTCTTWASSTLGIPPGALNRIAGVGIIDANVLAAIWQGLQVCRVSISTSPTPTRGTTHERSI